jgi:hypothetical protein
VHAHTSSVCSIARGRTAGRGDAKRVHHLCYISPPLQGREVHETQCLGCETVTRTDVVFYHLSLAIEQHSSLTHCLRQFR